MSFSSAPTTENSPTRPLLRGWLHVAGALILPCFSPILLVRAQTWAQTGWVLCYLVGVESMLITSALFHRVRWSPAHRRVLKRADHSAIFLAIAGSYLAIAGLTMHGRIRLVLLLVVGWAAVAVLPQIYRGGGATCFLLVVAGGLAYTLGALAYALKWPRLAPRVFGYHELFHAGTLLGAGLHFWALGVALH